MVNATVPLTIGGTSYLDGLIDEVRIYNRALSAEEVRYHYNHGGPVAAWDMDEGSGTKINDQSGNHNDGVLTNFNTTDSGTAESGTSDTLTDDNKTWTASQWVNGKITITSGTGAGQSKTVTANTGQTITVDSNWTTNPDSTSVYSLAQAPPWTSGKYGSACSLTARMIMWMRGMGRSLNITNAITVEAWVYPKNLVGEKTILRKEGQIAFNIIPNNLNLWLNKSGSWTRVVSTGGFSSSDINKWYHTVATWDGNYPKLYVNGKLEATGGQYIGPLNSSSFKYYIGVWTNESDWRYFSTGSLTKSAFTITRGARSRLKWIISRGWRRI